METTQDKELAYSSPRSIRRRPYLRILTVLGVMSLAASQVACANRRAAQTVTQDESLPRLRVNGTLLHVVEQGPRNAEVIIALHGGPGGDHRYLKVLEPLSSKYRVIWYDQRGTGLSARGQDWNKNDPVQTYLEDLDRLVEIYGGGKKVHLLGHSWGAMLASAYAGRHPDKVRGLILAEPGFLTFEESKILMSEGPSLDAIAKISGAWIVKWQVPLTDPEARQDWFLTQAMNVAQPPAYFCERGPASSVQSWRAGSAVYQATIGRAQEDKEYLHAMDFRAGVENITSKVLFLAGSCDSLIGEKHQRRLSAHFQQPKLVVIPNAGHYMFNDQPATSLRAVQDYLANL